MTQSLIGVAEVLASVLQEENAALLALDLPRAVALLARKHAAADALAAARVPAAAGTLAAAELGVLERMASRLDGLAAENRRLLERAIEVQREVMILLARAAPRRAAAPRYTAAGALAGTGGAAMAFSARA